MGLAFRCRPEPPVATQPMYGTTGTAMRLTLPRPHRQDGPGRLGEPRQCGLGQSVGIETGSGPIVLGGGHAILTVNGIWYLEFKSVIIDSLGEDRMSVFRPAPVVRSAQPVRKPTGRRRYDLFQLHTAWWMKALCDIE